MLKSSFVIALATSVLLATACSTAPSENAPPHDEQTNSDGGSSPEPEPSAPECGRLVTPCESGATCTGSADCASELCVEGTCRDVRPDDGIQNNDETDVDCGGTQAPACADGKRCLIANDCKSVVCTDEVCQEPSPTDKVQNGDETDVDCGGTQALPCEVGQGCAVDGDCNNVRCNPTTKHCNAPTDNDGLKNGSETGVDCGGPSTTKKCPPGEGCDTTSDCDKTKCDETTNTCDPPSATDGIRNGTETDIDCGGGAPTNAKRCVEGNRCSVDGDCDDFCNASSVCVTGRSCKASDNATAGIVTCGRGESNDAMKVHESCCRSLPVPGTPALRLDKYEVTAGRFRQFIETVGPNIRSWVQTEINANSATGERLASDIPASVRSLLPASESTGDALNLVTQVGGTVMDARRPSDVQGCYSDDGAYGHNTYWWDHDVLKSHFGATHAARRFTKAQYDEKSMNCAPYWMYAAFCAWDGGRMPTLDEIKRVWTARYPWGAAFATAVTLDGPPIAPASGVYPYTNTVNQGNDSLYFYAFPAYGNQHDTAGYIAAPGRFFRDATTIKVNGESWQDLGANNMEMVRYTSGTETFCDFNVFAGEATSPDCYHTPSGRYGVKRATSLPRVDWVGGSWEVHAIGNPVHGTYAIQTQYGKTGFRCARPALP